MRARRAAVRLERSRTTPVEASDRGKAAAAPTTSAAQARLAQKEMDRLERQVRRLDQRIGELHAALAEKATDFDEVMRLNEELRRVEHERDTAEAAWLELAQ